MKKTFQLSAILLLLALYTPIDSFGQATANNQDKPFIPTGRIWGYVFGDLFYKAQGENPGWGRFEYAKTDKDVSGGRLRRIYLGYDYQISEKFFSRVLLEGNEATTTSSGNFGLKIKLGYLEMKDPINLFHNSKIRGGLIPTPVFAMPEKVWGYRSVEKEALDLRGLSTSVDQGLSYEFDFTKNKDGGVFLMAGNGTGDKPGANKNLELYASVNKKFLDKKLTIEVLGDTRKTNDSVRRSIIRSFISYEFSKSRLGSEISQTFNDELVSGSIQEVKPLLFSIFYSHELPGFKNKVAVFGRYDYFNPDINFEKSNIYLSQSQYYDEHLFIVGLQYKVMDKILLMPNIAANVYNEKTDLVDYRKPDIVPRVTLYWLFGQ